MKVTCEEMIQIAEKVGFSRELTKQQRAILNIMAAHFMPVSCKLIADELHDKGWLHVTEGSIRVYLLKIRRKIAGTGLSMKSSMGRGGGIALRYDPAP